METEVRLAKNTRIRDTILATRAKRKTQQAVTRELKLVNLTPSQTEALTRVFLEAKWVYNHLVATSSWNTWDTKSKTVPVRLPDGSFEDRELKHLGSQVKQELTKGIQSSLRALATLKRNGKKVGALRPQRSFNGLNFVQLGITWRLKGNKLSLQGLPGQFSTRGAHQLEGLELSSAKLAHRPSGYYLKITGGRPP